MVPETVNLTFQNCQYLEYQHKLDNLRKEVSRSNDSYRPLFILTTIIIDGSKSTDRISQEDYWTRIFRRIKGIPYEFVHRKTFEGNWLWETVSKMNQ